MPDIRLNGFCNECGHEFNSEVQDFECPKCHCNAVIYTRELTCECGETVDLIDPLTNECPKCGRLFNSFGQELNPDEAYGDGKAY